MPRAAVSALPLLILALLPAGAYAQEGKAAPTDPGANTPSGTVYELPLDRARLDAAPRRSGSRTQARERKRATASPIRSENNFGSSSQVPGLEETSDRGADTGAEGGTDDTGGAAGGGDSPRGGGAGSNEQGDAEASETTATSGPSEAVVFPLVALLVAIGAGAGVLGGRAHLRRRS